MEHGLQARLKTVDARWMQGTRRGAVALALLALGAGFGAMVHADDGGRMRGEGPMAMAGHGQGGHGGMRGMHGGPGGGRIEPMLDAADATKEQRTKIRQIMVAAEEDVRAMHSSRTDDRDAMSRLLAQPKIDVGAIEKLRAQNVSRHDAVSKRMTQAMVDAANVLSPEQRAKVADSMARRRAMMDAPAPGMGAGPAPGRQPGRPDDAASR